MIRDRIESELRQKKPVLVLYSFHYQVFLMASNTTGWIFTNIIMVVTAVGCRKPKEGGEILDIVRSYKNYIGWSNSLQEKFRIAHLINIHICVCYIHTC